MESHSVLYVRVPPEDKVRLRALADKEFGGSLAATIRYLISRHTADSQRSAEMLAKYEEAEAIGLASQRFRRRQEQDRDED